MKKYKLLMLLLIIFAAPAIEAAGQSVLPESWRGFSPFPALIISMLLFFPYGWAPSAAMTAAMWRDVVLLEIYAPTLAGTVLGLTVLIFLRSLLIDKSLVNDLLMVIAVYAFYLGGELLSFGAAAVLQKSQPTEAVKMWPLVLNFVFVLLFFAYWRWRQTPSVSYNFYLP